MLCSSPIGATMRYVKSLTKLSWIVLALVEGTKDCSNPIRLPVRVSWSVLNLVKGDGGQFEP